MRTRSIVSAIGGCALALGIPLHDAHALYVSGNASTQAVGGTSQYVALPGPESTTGPVTTAGTCSTADALVTLSASAGTHVVLSHALGFPTMTCGANAYSSDNVTYSDNFVIQSGSLAPGTPVDISLCVDAAIRHAAVFQCGGNVNEDVGNQATTNVSIAYGTTTQAASGAYSERIDCSDPHGETETGLYSDGGQTLTLTGVPVGGVVTVNTSTSISSTAISLLYPSESDVEVGLVVGYSSASDVKLVSTTTSTELNPASLCSESIAASLLPSNPQVLAVGDGTHPSAMELLAPSPNPARGPVSVTFHLPRDESFELAVFNLEGARVAGLARGAGVGGARSVVWNGRDDRGRTVGPGVYWLRLSTPDGHAERMVVRIR